MNDLLFLVPVAILLVVLIPTLLEVFRRKDKGPRVMPETTIYPDKMELDWARDSFESYDLPNTRKEKDINIPDGSEIQGNLISEGPLKIGCNCHVLGTLKASEKIEIGESSIIDGSVLSTGPIVVGQNCKIGGVVVSTEDITLSSNVCAEAITTEKTVKLGKGVKINKRISGTAFVSHDCEGEA